MEIKVLDKKQQEQIYENYLRRRWDELAAASWFGYLSEGKGFLVIHPEQVEEPGHSKSVFSKGRNIPALNDGIPLLTFHRMTGTYISAENLENGHTIKFESKYRKLLKLSNPDKDVTIVTEFFNGDWLVIHDRANNRLLPSQAYKIYADVFTVWEQITQIEAKTPFSFRWDVLKVNSIIDALRNTQGILTIFIGANFQYSLSTRHLALYGSLQALFTQQDAVIHLCKMLEINTRNELLDHYPILGRIRDIRNRSIGHPTETSQRKTAKAINLIVPATDPTSFYLASLADDAETSHEYVNVRDLINEQQACLKEILDAVLVKLNHTI